MSFFLIGELCLFSFVFVSKNRGEGNLSTFQSEGIKKEKQNIKNKTIEKIIKRVKNLNEILKKMLSKKLCQCGGKNSCKKCQGKGEYWEDEGVSRQDWASGSTFNIVGGTQSASRNFSKKQ